MLNTKQQNSQPKIALEKHTRDQRKRLFLS